ncbi:MAG: citrate lyase ACP [Bacteroidetes bacterium]|nr:MAG: citrate lyase ACP [Bacteroidota bacterium]PIE88379.1 MAG: citrate lyase ACP [Bacteroidota bacterium]
MANVGNKGKGVRSDCFVSLELVDDGGVQVDLQSKVQVLFGKSIVKQVTDILSYFGIENARISIEDTGALPFVIAARVEAAVKKVWNTDKEYLMPLLEQNRYRTARDKRRFSRLYLPGNTPRLFVNAGIHRPDGIILDLEDAVAPDKKEEARYMVRNALCQCDFYGAERMVRINQLPLGLEDLPFVVPHNVNLLLIPKCESVEQINRVNASIKRIQEERKVEGDIWLMPIIESALGVEHAFEIASGEKVVALAIGLEDFTADLGTQRTEEGSESFFARTRIVNACKAARIQAIDSVYSDVSNMEGLKANVLRSKALGFDGMGCIHPRQIGVIHQTFGPGEKEIEKAKKIVIAFDRATEKGLGVVSLGSKMIDPPVVKRALRTIAMAVEMGLLTNSWKEEENEEVR